MKSTDDNFGFVQFLLCLGLHMLAPIAALLLIAVARGSMDTLDESLTAILFVLALALHSERPVFRTASLLGCGYFGIWLGRETVTLAAAPILSLASWAAMGIAFAVHWFERWDRHVRRQESFFHS